MLAIISGVLIKEKNNLIYYLKEVGISTVFLNITTILIGFVTAKFFKLKTPQALSIAIETGIQNSALAITIAIVLLNNTQFAIAASIYTLSMYFTGSLLIFIAIKTQKIALL